MGFVKVVKNKAYFKRFQVKYRRRREGKTDYGARRVLVKQEKCKYNSPKHRFVVRFTNKRVICQVMYATVHGDKCVCAAESNELKAYGISVGLKNYAAAYATGLLMARRLLKQVGLDTMYPGVKEVNGEFWNPEDDEDNQERHAFKAYLDVGLVRCTTGNRVFGALKGAVDGGMNIPHSNKRFPGYAKGEGKDGEYSAETHKDRICGMHVSEYMNTLKEEAPDSFDRQFATYNKNKISSDKLKDMYLKAHAAIRANPVRVVKKASQHAPVHKREGRVIKTSKASYERPIKLTSDERKARVARKFQIAAEQLSAAAAAE